MDAKDTPPSSPDMRQDLHPGTTISPRDVQAPPAQPETPTVVPPASSAPATPAQTVIAPNQTVAAPADPSAPALPSPVTSGGFFRAGDPKPAQQQPAAAQAPADTFDAPAEQAAEPDPGYYEHDTGDTVAWTASEFIAHHKNAGWYLAMAGAGAVITGLVYLLTRDVVSTGVVAIACGIFAYTAAHKPRQIQYSVSDDGLKVGNKLYPFNTFRSFTVSEEDHFRSFTFMPLKRFMPIMSVYYDPQDEERIGDIVSAHLPFEPRQLDLTERFLKRIRF